MSRAHAARGFTMVELVIALTLLAIIGAAVTRLLVMQSRAFAQQAAAKSARAVTRASLNFIQSELRMVEVGGGVTAATPRSVTFRVPYALGVVCNPTTISTLPPDSLAFALASFRGYAWRDSTGRYNYTDPASSATPASLTGCSAAGVTTVSGGLALTLSPSLSINARIGDNVLLFQSVNYAFGPSGLLPGRWGLFRTVLPGGTSEELAAPFDSASSLFAFFNLNTDTAQAVVPPLANIRGIELRLTGQSVRIPRGSAGYASSTLRTGILFANRMR